MKIMNPSGTSRPVMDVSAPRPSQSPTPATTSDEIAVRPAPMSAEMPKAPQITPSTEEPKSSKSTTQHQPVQPRSGAPVGVITVAVLVMMLLSVAAVIVYATSQTA